MTRTLVCFRTSSGRYAVPVEQVVEVRPADGLVPVPRAQDGVLGLLPAREGERTVTVVEALGQGRDHVLVLQEPRGPFGLRVEVVQGLVRLPDDAFGPAPQGQHDDVVVAVVRLEGERVLVVDAVRLAGALFGAQGPPGLKDDAFRPKTTE